MQPCKVTSPMLAYNSVITTNHAVLQDTSPMFARDSVITHTHSVDTASCPSAHPNDTVIMDIH
jgi:hypothetical protein